VNDSSRISFFRHTVWLNKGNTYDGR